MKYLLLTDSLSLPRKHEGGKVSWEDTYYYRLKKANPNDEFILAAIGGATITELFLLLNYYKHTDPDYVILHSGIVDCSPRALSKLELQLVIKFHLFRLVNPFTRFLRKHRGIRYTKPAVFAETIEKIKSTFKDKPFVSIGILPGCEPYEKIVPGISKNIAQYNNILKNAGPFINNDDFPRDGIISDFHHMNEKGHEIVFNKIQNMMNARV